jgi:hypothetical protein
MQHLQVTGYAVCIPQRIASLLREMNKPVFLVALTRLSTEITARHLLNHVTVRLLEQ